MPKPKRTTPSITEVVNHKGRVDYSKYNLSRSRAIKLHCLDCMGNQPKEVRECQDIKCALWRYRHGGEIACSNLHGNRPCPDTNHEAKQKGAQQ